MVSNLWERNKEIANLSIIEHNYPKMVRTFYLIAIILLSLLLPLSFLLLARLSSANYILSLTSNNPPPKSLFYSLFLYTNPNLIHALLSIISITTLINALLGRAGPLNKHSRPILRVHGAWIFLCTLQVCVGLGIEASIDVGIDTNVEFEYNRSILAKLVFFLGLHETMVHWARTIVRPIVDDTMYGGAQEEGWVDRWALATAFGTLSWWRLRDEVEALVVVVVFKRDMMMKIGFDDFIGWWLFYLMVVIGFVRILNAILWFVMSVYCKLRRIEDDFRFEYQDNQDNQDIV